MENIFTTITMSSRALSAVDPSASLATLKTATPVVALGYCHDFTGITGRGRLYNHKLAAPYNSMDLM